MRGEERITSTLASANRTTGRQQQEQVRRRRRLSVRAYVCAPCYESPRLHPLCPSPSPTLNVVSPVLHSFASRGRHWPRSWEVVGIYWAVMSMSKGMSLASACRPGSRPSCCDFLFLGGTCGAVKSCYWHYHLRVCIENVTQRERPILTLWRLGDVLDCLSDSLDSIGIGIWDLLCIR